MAYFRGCYRPRFRISTDKRASGRLPSPQGRVVALGPTGRPECLPPPRVNPAKRQFHHFRGTALPLLPSGFFGRETEETFNSHGKINFFPDSEFNQLRIFAPETR